MLYSFLDYPVGMFLSYNLGVLPDVVQVEMSDAIADTLAFVHSHDSTIENKNIPVPAVVEDGGRRNRLPDADILPVGIDRRDLLQSGRAVLVDDDIPAPPPARGNVEGLGVHGKARFNFLGILGVEEYQSLHGSLLGVGVGIQVVGRRYGEESVLGAMEVIQDLLR
jgi:hypothetical protein